MDKPGGECPLTLLHSEGPKFYGVLALLSAQGLMCMDKPELQIRGSTEDNLNVIFLIFKETLCCDLSLELS